MEIHRRKFLNPVKSVLTDGKLRVSYGVNGTQPSDYYAYMNLYKYGIIYNGQSGMSIVGIANPDLKWEKEQNMEYRSRPFIHRPYLCNIPTISVKPATLYMTSPYHKSADIMMAITYTTPQNIGSLKNSGLSWPLHQPISETKDFTWTTSLNMAHLKQQTDQTGWPAEWNRIRTTADSPWAEPYYSYYVYEYAGVDAETGKEMFYLNDGTENARKTTTISLKPTKLL